MAKQSANIASEGKKSPMPASISPMLCTLIREPFTDTNWIFEVKWDGYRILAFIKNGKAILKSRGDQDYTNKYAAVSKAFKELKHDAVIDGEVVVLDKEGKPDFSAMQNYREGDPIVYYVFDLIWLNGSDLKEVPLERRKELLQEILPESNIIKFSDSFDDGLQLFESIKQMGLEGIVAKKRDSIYVPGKKGDTWYKAKMSERQEYVIGGWTRK